MGQDSKIEWTHHTFNPWRGCTKVSPGCTNCYAEMLSHRNPKVLGVWGDKGTRVVASDSMWREPLKWDREAKEAGERRRVFCASLADVFEDREELDEPRFRLLRLIASTTNLDWLLLTKRPDRIEPILKRIPSPLPGFTAWDDWCQEIADKVWLGTSVEDQQRADERIPALLQVPAAVRFLSAEPLLGPIDLSRFLGFQHEDEIGIENRDQSLPREMRVPFHDPWVRGIDWAIIGGESGSNARPCDVAWIRSIRDQCRAARVPVFIKQMGAKPYWTEHPGVAPGSIPAAVIDSYICSGCGEPDDVDHWIDLRDPKGGDWGEWPEDLRIREFPNAAMAI